MSMIINPYLVTLLLQAITVPTAVSYSAARRLSSTYNGALIRVRRSSDNAEQNIGYTMGNLLDEAALTSFVGAGNGFVTTWYDQSGNNKDASQSTASQQPRIVLSGTIEKLLNKPSLRFFSSSNTTFQLNFSTGSFSAASAFTLYNRTSADSFYAVIYAFGGGSNDNYHQPYTATTYDGFFMTSRLNLGSTSIGTGNFILQQINNGTSLIDYYNNISSNTVNGTFVKSSIYRIGGNASAPFYLDDKMSEHILWLSNKSSDRTGINTNINTFYSIY